MEASVEAELARLSGEEMASALGLGRAPTWVRRLGRVAFEAPSRPVARVLARFDRRIPEVGLDVAAAEALSAFGARWSADIRPPREGGLLAIANHPGAYDALSLMAALGRPDLRIVAAERRFLRAMPHLAERFLFVEEQGAQAARSGAVALRGAARHLRRGGALLHFAAGRIEPDPAFLAVGEEPLGAWRSGTGALLRAAAAAGGRVVVAVVEGVHSRRAKRLWVTRLAERRGITTLAPLLQAALPGFGDVRVRVRLSEARPAEAAAEELGHDDAAITARLRAEALSLLGWRGSG